MITELTKEQEALFPEFVKKWTDIGLSTSPADKRKAEECIKKMYKNANLATPKIVWTSSPLALGLTVAIVKHYTTTKVDPNVVLNGFYENIHKATTEVLGEDTLGYVQKQFKKLDENVKESARNSINECGYGSHDAGWLSFYDYFREIGLKNETEKLVPLIELAKVAGWYLPYTNFCFMSDKHHILNRDNQGRLHSMTEPAISYPDGWSIYAVHGVRVPAMLIEEPEKITIHMIENERNAEIRRVMIEQYGQDKYMVDSGAKLISKDDLGELYKKDVDGDEPIVMVKVNNSSPEPDGTVRVYWLRVPPDMTSVRQALAWTFSKTTEEYRPLMET